MKKIEKDMTFEELVEIAAIRIHSALLVGGGKEMKSEIFTWMSNAIRWSHEKKTT